MVVTFRKVTWAETSSKTSNNGSVGWLLSILSQRAYHERKMKNLGDIDLHLDEPRASFTASKAEVVPK